MRNKEKQDAFYQMALVYFGTFPYNRIELSDKWGVLNPKSNKKRI